jgi:hypothetical protein
MKTCRNQLSVNLLYQQKKFRKVTSKANIYKPRIFPRPLSETSQLVPISGLERSSSSLESHEPSQDIRPPNVWELIQTVQVAH